jgi:CheY-like chemotaxis protein
MGAPGGRLEIREGLEPRERAQENAVQVVLVVDDESTVRKLMAAVLERAGYRILEACCGEDAVRVAEAHDGPIDLLLTDIIMPGMDGWELARQLGAVRTDMKIIYTSGNIDRAGSGDGAAEPCILLRKPFTPDQLVQTAAELLNEPQRKPPVRHE